MYNALLLGDKVWEHVSDVALELEAANIHQHLNQSDYIFELKASLKLTQASLFKLIGAQRDMKGPSSEEERVQMRR